MSACSAKYITVIFSLLAIWLAGTPVPGAQAGEVRKPAVAGTFYPADPDELAQTIDQMSRQARKGPVKDLPDQPLKALIMPHAGYEYSGPVAARAAQALEGQSFSKVIIMAPDHRVGFDKGAISDADSYRTPLGHVDLHPDASHLRKQYDMFRPVTASDKREHAVEVILPFLQTWHSDFEIVPVVFGKNGNIKAYAEALETVVDSSTLIIVSTDLSHYLPYEKAVSRDRKTIEIITGRKSEELAADPRRACGWKPLLVLMEMTRGKQWNSRLVHYANSGDTAGRRDQVVGYATIAFYGEARMSEPENNQQISKEKGEVLLEVARKSIADRLGVETGVSTVGDDATRDPVFQSKRGTFVTLKINDQLRGCIGNLVPEKPLIEGVRDNAVNAAFSDPRFGPLSPEEFSKIQIEVSLLTEPQPLEYTDAQDLLDKIRPHVDGLIIQKGARSATFLPQVWEQLPDKKSFLQQLCMKAGLPPDAWKKGDLQVFTYQVQYFEEPN